MQKAKYTVTSEQMLNQVYQDALRGIEDHGFIKLEWKAGSNRSINQNDLYWMWIGEIVRQTNEKSEAKFTKEEMHEWLKHEFLGYENKVIGKKKLITLCTTTKLTKGEMFYYMQQVDAFAHSHGFKLTIPDDSEYMKLKQRENQ